MGQSHWLGKMIASGPRDLDFAPESQRSQHSKQPKSFNQGHGQVLVGVPEGPIALRGHEEGRRVRSPASIPTTSFMNKNKSAGMVVEAILHATAVKGPGQLVASSSFPFTQAFHSFQLLYLLYR